MNTSAAMTLVVLVALKVGVSPEEYEAWVSSPRVTRNASAMKPCTAWSAIWTSKNPG
jgi:hypothetical protein